MRSIRANNVKDTPAWLSRLSDQRHGCADRRLFPGITQTRPRIRHALALPVESAVTLGSGFFRSTAGRVHLDALFLGSFGGAGFTVRGCLARRGECATQGERYQGDGAVAPIH